MIFELACPDAKTNKNRIRRCVLSRNESWSCPSKVFHGTFYFEAFLKTLEESHSRFGLQILSYCLNEIVSSVLKLFGVDVNSISNGCVGLTRIAKLNTPDPY